MVFLMLGSRVKLIGLGFVSVVITYSCAKVQDKKRTINEPPQPAHHLDNGEPVEAASSPTLVTARQIVKALQPSGRPNSISCAATSSSRSPRWRPGITSEITHPQARS